MIQSYLATCTGELHGGVSKKEHKIERCTYLVTDLVPRDSVLREFTQERIRRTAVWISREEMVDFLE